MDFYQSADASLEGCMCACGAETVLGHPVYADIDGGYGDDGRGVKVTVRCCACEEKR